MKTLKKLLSITALGALSTVNATNRPNVIFLFVDDMTYDGVAALGNDEVLTPNLDALVHSGTAFMNTFNMGGWHGAISVASRSMVLTGKYVWHAHQCEREQYKPNIEAAETLPQVFKRAGYHTYMTGKWHVDHVRPEQLFDVTEDVRPGGCPALVELEYDRPQSRDDNRWLPWDKQWGGYWKGGKHWSEVQADDIVRFIDNNSQNKEPLFMYCAFNAPHDPRQSPKEFVDMYDVDKIRVPENFMPEHPLKELMGCDQTMRDERIAPFPRTQYSVQKHRQEYYAIISHLDAQIGRILDAVKRNNMSKNTIIVFAADNGLGCGQHGLMGKQNMYDHSMKVPLVISGKSIPKDKKVFSLNYMQDWIPTVYEIIGIAQPQGMEYKSLTPVMKGKANKHREAIYGAFSPKWQRMVRTEKYKLFFIPQAKTIYLFDVENDPYETKNLANDPTYAPVIKDLARQYLSLAAETGDPLNIKQIYPNLFE